MTGAVAAAMISRKAATLSGSFSASGAGPVVTSPTITFTVPAPSPRDFRIDAFVDIGVVTGSRYNKNAAGLTACPDPTTISMANGDTLLVDVSGCTAGESRQFTLTDTYTGIAYGPYVLSGV